MAKVLSMAFGGEEKKAQPPANMIEAQAALKKVLGG